MAVANPLSQQAAEMMAASALAGSSLLTDPYVQMAFAEEETVQSAPRREEAEAAAVHAWLVGHLLPLDAVAADRKISMNAYPLKNGDPTVNYDDHLAPGDLMNEIARKAWVLREAGDTMMEVVASTCYASVHCQRPWQQMLQIRAFDSAVVIGRLPQKLRQAYRFSAE